MLEKSKENDQFTSIAKIASWFSVPLPYQPTSSRLWNWSVIFGIAVAMMLLSAV